MARSAVTVTDLTLNAATAKATTAIDATNLNVITPAAGLSRILIKVINTTASTKVLTIKAGDNPPATHAGLGDLAISFAQDAEKYIVLESARFLQDDGTINIDPASSMTGTIECYRLPKR